MTREELYLGSFLHDIGKFYQRADGALNDKNELSEQSKKLAEIICPEHNGFPSHQHVVWTNEFFEKNQQIFLRFISKDQLSNIVHAAVYHHRPDNPEAAIVQLADWWASGMDRSSMGIFEDPQLEKSELRFREIPLNNILCALRVKQSDNSFQTASRQSVFRLRPLSLHAHDIMPSDYSNETKLSTELYRKHWKEFIADLEKLEKRSFDYRGLSITLYYLLKKYTWCIPSFTQDNHPCISLFEHSKVTAAIAQCLFDFYQDKPESFRTNTTPKGYQVELDENVFPLLIAGFDLSGIQDYLYNISSANAAKSLRGRSFYLQMTLEALAWQIINKAPLKLTPAHIIYASGGKFYMLLPNIPIIKKYLEDFYIGILDDLWEKHRGRLYLNMGMVAFRYKNKLEANQKNIRIEGHSENVSLGELWNALFEEMTRHEARRFRHIIASRERFAEFFEPSGEGGDSLVCSVTGEEIGHGKAYYQFNEEKRDWSYKTKAENYDAEAPVISPEVHQQIEIGKQLVHHNFIAFPTSATKAEGYFDLPGGSKLHIAKNENVSSYDEALILKTVHDEVSLFDVPAGNRQALGFRFFGGSQVAMEDKNTPATFEYLAGYIEGSNKGRYPFKRLAILRMDVDGLGSLFRYGLTDDEKPTELASFSAYATFSNLLDLFFSGYINTLREKYKEDVNILYSGGDDVFALGYWEKVIAFAEDVRSEFRKFAARDDITLSAGIELVGAKFPVAKGAEKSGEAEEKAKQHKIDTGNGKVVFKNALCFLGVPLNWDHEWPQVKNLKEKLVHWVRDESITRGLLMQLIGYYEAWKYNTKDDKEYHNWKWQAAYNIARRQKNLKEDKNAGANEALEELKQIIFAHVNEKRMRFEAFAVACRWAELALRNEKEKTN
ncbi:MAG: type III-A CRISPR-associated protein Cas10/Csm1 [Bacteroidales bacterium]|nr:type III-A CRISPR-associated protein Cas10/Csm1 [Bacteroidales bacterium]